MKFIRYAVLAVAVLLLPAPALAQVPVAAGAPRSDQVQVGDAVRITVWRNADLSGQIDIAEDGTMIHPLYRTVRAAGLTLPQLESEIREVLLRYESGPQFVVEPLFRVMITGEIRSPDIYAFPPRTTIAEAIARAGGVTEFARSDRARLLRDGQTQYIDLTRPYIELEGVRIRSGDQIVIDRNRRIWRDTVQPTLGVVGSLSSLAIIFLRVTRAW
jgi:polysaccharide biosynthesis/export protein